MAQSNTPVDRVDQADKVYPLYHSGLGSCVEGSKVRDANGAVYQCKGFPFSGWCNVWSAGSNQYEPGLGAAWEQAWVYERIITQ